MVYKWYILPIGGLYSTYHLLGEPKKTIELTLRIHLPPMETPSYGNTPDFTCHKTGTPHDIPRILREAKMCVSRRLGGFSLSKSLPCKLAPAKSPRKVAVLEFQQLAWKKNNKNGGKKWWEMSSTSFLCFGGIFHSKTRKSSTCSTHEPRKRKQPYFPLNPGCLIGILISWYYYVPHITG